MFTSRAPVMGVDVEPLTTASAPPELYTYDDVAAAMRVTKQTVYEWVKRGRIVSPIYSGSTARFTADMLADVMNGPKEPGSYAPADSPRARVGLLGWKAKKKKAAKKSSSSTAKKSSSSTAKKSSSSTAKKAPTKERTK